MYTLHKLASSITKAVFSEAPREQLAGGPCNSCKPSCKRDAGKWEGARLTGDGWRIGQQRAEQQQWAERAPFQLTTRQATNMAQK
jgi:hypothetical protein